MNYRLSLLVIISLFLKQAGIAQGLVFDKDSFLAREKIDLNRGVSYTSYSLERYAPIPYPQSGGTCVAHSFTNARSILLAMEVGAITDKQKALTLFSPYHFYRENRGSGERACDNGLNIDVAARYALNKGFVPLHKVEYSTYYPFSDKELCNVNYYPTDISANRVQALKFVPDAIYRVENVLDIRTAISRNMPIVLAMAVPNSFMNCSSSMWVPKSTDSIKDSYGHAVLCVGYDDDYLGGAVRIMNSWGTGWADRGFVWVRYSDLGNWTYGGYAVEKSTRTRGEQQNDIFQENKIANYFEDQDSLFLEILASTQDSSLKTQEVDTILSSEIEISSTLESIPKRNHNLGIFRKSFGLE